MKEQLKLSLKGPEGGARCKNITETPTQRVSYEHKSHEKKGDMHIHQKSTLKEGIRKTCFYFVLFITVDSWFCLFKQCGEMSQCPHVVAAWAVKQREGTVADRKLIPIHKL